ncbi:hypothetical protein N0V93_005052 [Gnomoniopsis smithogilvyi]|uniref:Xaa-Pro aminopeptidase n=1 Tax=Gnomoniopsis smithogilvyi TaxID=1191159 RepID=A0A9W8YUU9_9PEZI|nr:hypothetical protein N0V93_005052 [Gnomoniopsis smithogilvyi]
METHYDYNLVDVDEFDALSIELRLQSSNALIYPGTEAKQSQPEKYPAKTHARKVKDELNVTSGLVYLDGQVEKHWEDTDGDMPFRQRRYAFYLSGANFPGIKVTYDIAKDSLILWVPVRPPSKVLWYGTIPSIKECMAKFDVDSVRDIADLQAYLEEILDPQSNPTTVHVLHMKERPPPLSWERPADGITLQPDDASLKVAMAFARAVKTPYEISKIRRANEISSEAHREVLRHIKSLKNEAQVESIFLSKCRELGAKQQAYPPIAGSGPNAAVLHYSANDQDFGKRQLMVLDAGAEFDCYASDVTRTFPLNGKLSHEAKKVYQIVLAMQESCINMIRPGTSWRDVQLNAVDVARKGLLNIGILQPGHSGQMPSNDAVRPFFPHGLGHLVGLDTHDVILEAVITFGGKRHSWDALAFEGSNSAARKLMEGMVITCEPGIYFNRAFIDDYLSTTPYLEQYVNRAMLEEYYPVAGCRLEDCILVTDNGWENLTTAPKGNDMIEAINGGA